LTSKIPIDAPIRDLAKSVIARTSQNSDALNEIFGTKQNGPRCGPFA
jgi:hypothetical protein